MKKWLMAVLFGTVLVLGACGGGGDTNDTEEPADTESLQTKVQKSQLTMAAL